MKVVSIEMKKNSLVTKQFNVNRSDVYIIPKYNRPIVPLGMVNIESVGFVLLEPIGAGFH